MTTRFPASCYLYLTALCMIFAYAVFQSGGIQITDWNACMVSLGLLILLYYRFNASDGLAPVLEWWLSKPLLLLLCFITLQIIPLPLWLLRAVSPARAALSQALDGVMPRTAFASISVFPSATLAHLLRVSAYTIVFAITRELAWKTRERRWLMIAPIVVIGAAEAVWGALQYSPESAAHGTYVNRDHFAGLLELSFPFAIVYPIAALRKPPSQSFRQALLVSISLASALLMLLGIMLSLSRMGFIASLCGLFVAVPLALSVHAPRGRRVGAIVLVAAVLIITSLYIAPERLISRFAEVGESHANLEQDVRPRVWKDAWAVVADYPLVGCGLGAFEQTFTQYRTFLPELAIATVHNDYLEFLAELGAIGFAIAAFGMTALFVSAARLAVHTPDPSARYIAIGSCASLVAILIHSFVDHNLYIPANAMLVAWIAGVVSTLNVGSVEFTSRQARLHQSMPSR